MRVACEEPSNEGRSNEKSLEDRPEVGGATDENWDLPDIPPSCAIDVSSSLQGPFVMIQGNFHLYNLEVLTDVVSVLSIAFKDLNVPN